MKINEKGLTVVELIVALSVFAVVAVVAWQGFEEFKKNSYDLTAKSDLRQLITASEISFAENHEYPSCDSPSNCERVFNGFMSTRLDNGEYALDILEVETDELGNSIKAFARHSKSSDEFTFDSSTGDIESSAESRGSGAVAKTRKEFPE